MTMLHIILQDFVDALVIIFIPFIAKYLVMFLDKAKEETAERIKNKKIENTITRILEIVENSVIATNQTFVSEVKKSDGLTINDKKEAYDKTLSMIKTMLTNDMIDLIVDEYGDLDAYLKTLIEKIVAEKKK